MQEIHAKAFERWGYTHVISVDQLSQDKFTQLLRRLLVLQKSERENLNSLHKPDEKPGEQVAKKVILSYL